MRGEISTGRAAKRHPLDWYAEQGWEWEQIVDAIGLAPEITGRCAIWDPACGYGHSLSRLQGIGFEGALIASDLVDNLARDDFDAPPRFFSWDFVEYNHPNFTDPAPEGALSIFCNPPFSYKKVRGETIGQAFARRALARATHRVVFLLPLKWQAGQARGWFLREHPPQTILIFTQRPSMPPGDRIALMGDRAYSGGMVDYCALVWDVRNPTAPGDTRTIWLPPLGGQY